MESSDVRWRAMAADLRSRIESGEYAVGSRIPSYRELASIHGVSVGTARAAVEELMAEGWVRSTQGVGLFVADRSLMSSSTPSSQREQDGSHEDRLTRLEGDVARILRHLGLD